MILFVLGSLLLHVLVVALWRGESPAGPAGQSTFKVTLVARHGDVVDQAGAEANGAANGFQHQPADRNPSSGGHTVATRKTAQKALPVTPRALTLQSAVQAESDLPKPDARQLPATENTLAGSGNESQKPVPAEPDRIRSGGQSASVRGSTSYGEHQLTSAARYSRVRAELLRALLPHFEYPPVARRRGWQGRATVGLHVGADGDLTRVHLVRSSGHSLLDRAAVKNVADLRKVPGASQWLNGSDMDIVLPVRYQLQNR